MFILLPVNRWKNTFSFSNLVQTSPWSQGWIDSILDVIATVKEFDLKLFHSPGTPHLIQTLCFKKIKMNDYLKLFLMQQRRQITKINIFIQRIKYGLFNLEICFNDIVLLKVFRWEQQSELVRSSVGNMLYVLVWEKDNRPSAEDHWFWDRV